MNAPDKFDSAVGPLRHTGPDIVRCELGIAGYRQFRASSVPKGPGKPARGRPEVWVRMCPDGGLWQVRLDLQGNAPGGISPGPHGGRPHYHKEWAPHPDAFPGKCAAYDDAGERVTDQPGTSRYFARVHIPR